MNLNQYKPTKLKAEIEVWFDHDPYDINRIEIDIDKDKEYDTGTELLNMFKFIVNELRVNETPFNDNEANIRINLFRG
tara:strand:- start:311 stop:544 length:234 start_codon:yes stop_codon:yes gene_type:complete